MLRNPLFQCLDAYGFHVKNCIVRDDISGIEHKMIDELGCSTDLSIFSHPHYDTYHDTASTHLWAFKPPFCPDLITSPANSILYDAEGALLKRRRQIAGDMTQSVRAALCTGGACDPEALDSLPECCVCTAWSGQIGMLLLRRRSGWGDRTR
ncbi:hypothetical protein OESDEN_10096 [Oesophagostomum dentatum]|uniref:Uncharacterized protein n=1 Tax=Oesophagostomum dentatum TaxID=61180 RepID=A0A0B1T2Q4_OESDE|nr:hypothetical protein OESDEN_10096 [Oesophagostomum dentatum]